MEKGIYCLIHKNKLIDAVCLEKECTENSLMCYHCRIGHQDHIYSCIHLQDLIENIESRFNLSVVSNQFNFQLNKLKFLKEEFQQSMKNQKQKIIQLIDKSIREFNLSIDAKIQNIQVIYHQNVQFMQKFRNLSMQNSKENMNVLTQIKSQFKIAKDIEKQNVQFLSSMFPNKNQIEIIHEELINSEFQQAQQYYKQIADDVIQYLNNFETLWTNQTKNTSLLSQICFSQMSIQNQMSHNKDFNLRFEKVNTKQDQSLSRNSQHIQNLIYYDEQKQIDSNIQNNYNNNRYYEIKAENNDQVIQTNKVIKYEQSPQISKPQPQPLFGTFQQSLPFPQINSIELKDNCKQEKITNSQQSNGQALQSNVRNLEAAIKQYTFSSEQKINTASSENKTDKNTTIFQSTTINKSSQRYSEVCQPENFQQPQDLKQE